MRQRLVRFLLSAFTAAMGLPLAGQADEYASGQNYARAGQFRLAIESFQAAASNAQVAERRAQAHGALGLLHYQLNHNPLAQTELEQALRIGSNDVRSVARWQATLGRLLATQGHTGEAQRLLTEAAQSANDPLLRAGIELAIAELQPDAERLAMLTAIGSRLQALPASLERGGYLVNLAVQARRLGSAGTKLAYTALTTAQAAAPAEPRFQAEVLGELAQLYEDEPRRDDALRLNREALAMAPSGAQDLRLELEWRQARLLRANGEVDAALHSFQRAVDHVEAIRADIPLDYHDGRSSFRDTLEPLYLQYADLLLSHSAKQSAAEQRPVLRRARQVVEFIKQSEFEEFLGGRCAVHPVADTGVDAIAPQTAVLYPIILPNRLELLVSSGGSIQQFTRAVDAETLRDTVRRFAAALRSAQPNAKELAQTLYRWLIEPIDPWLREHSVNTLVMVPDGVLRLIPLAALHDGQGYLVERYALGTSPGLSLIAPSPLAPRQAETLLAGMDEPGAVIDHLPPAFLETLDTGGARGLKVSPSSRSRAVRLATASEGGPTRQADPSRSLRNAEFRENLKEALRLPGVTEELQNLKSALPSTVLLGEDFTAARFKREMLATPYSIVHIASHGILGSTAASSFILAYDEVIGLDQLESLLKSDKFAKQPVELLTLSACQTAEGDDRAPLGFSGIALKTKVRSALGSLWPVNDEAASKLMVGFYQALNQRGTGRALALQRAQKAMLVNPKLNHPFYWAPFILVGNWL